MTIADVERKAQSHFVPNTCVGEICGICWREGRISVDARHKVGEELAYDIGHNLTQYVCCKHFAMIVGSESAKTWRGCDV